MNIILLGAPGSGKGTQAEKLVGNNGFVQFSTGDLMRKEISEKTELGLECQKYIEQGKLVPDAIVNGIVKNYLETNNDNLIFDGFPRTLDQAKALDEMLKEVNSEIDSVIYIDVARDILLERISGRLICPTCKRSYHIKNRPPKEEGICDFDGTKLVRRADDDPAKVAVRLDAYENETKPLVEYYASIEKVIKVNGHDSNPETVYNEIIETLGLNK